MSLLSQYCFCKSRNSDSVAKKPTKFLPFTIALLAASLFSTNSAFGQSHTPPYKDLHDFGGTITLTTGASGADGTQAQFVVVDKSGDKFIVANQGGANGKGGLYEYTAAGAYLDLHDFGGTAVGPSGTTDPDGENPVACVVDPNGNIFGTATGGGVNNLGAIWELTSGGVYKLLYEFGNQIVITNGSMGPDGRGTGYGAPVVDASGNLFGISGSGGYLPSNPFQSGAGLGMVWEIPAGGTFKDIHDFGLNVTLADGTSGTDNAPSPAICLDSLGDLYGVNQTGTKSAAGGDIWEITTAGQYIDLHDFGGKVLETNGTMQTDGTSGQYVICDANDNLYGTCLYGNNLGNNGGVIWELSANGGYEVLHNFGSSINTNISQPIDGKYPTGPIVLDTAGNLYGYISNNSYSFLWELNSTGYYDINDFGGTITSAGGGQVPDGTGPSWLAIDSSNNLFGTSVGGGADNQGLFYSMSTITTLSSFGVGSQTIDGSYYYGGNIRISTSSTTRTAISMSSNNPNVPVSSSIKGAIPPNVVVPAGQSLTLFSFTPISTYDNETATITASYNGVSLTGTVQLYAVALTGFGVGYYDGLGEPTTGTLTLNETAPSNGVVVNLVSTNPSITVPASVTVPAGQTTVQFPINVNGSTSQTETGTITASYNGASFSQNLTVDEVSLTGLSITPTEAQGGTTFNATATLNALAPAGGVQLAVSTTSSYVSAPATVTVPAGSSSVTFPLPTSVTGANATVKLNVSLGSELQYLYFTLDKTVLPPTISKLTVSPGEGPSGSTFTATATINEVAPTGGTVITLATNSSYVSPPATVTVPAGSTSVSFPVPTSGSPSTINVLLRGTTGSTAQAVYFTLDSVPAPPLVNLTVSPGEALGGTTFTGTITLASAAPYPISVSTATNSSFVSIPAIVVVPTGSTTATYSIKTKVVYNTIPVLLKATLGSTTKTQYITLDASPLPVTLSSLTVSPTEATGGTTFTATVTLSGAAPSGGYVVALATNSGYLSPPASVTVPAGATSVTFSVSSSAVSKSISALLKASDSSTTKTVYVTLDP